MLTLRILASGSSGNAALLRLGEQRLLLDAGISYSRMRDALEAAGESFDAVDAVLLTHEHRDHVAALPQIKKRHPAMPLLATPGTVSSWRRSYGWRFGARPLIPGQPLRLGDAEVMPYAIRHDAGQPIGLRVSWRGAVVGLATDLGTFDRSVCNALTDCTVLLLESNHDPTMLAYGSYPPHLKRRVASNVGHLSNGQACSLLRHTAWLGLQTVALVHLSGENNTAEAALEAVQPALTRFPMTSLVAAARRAPSEAITVEPRRALKRRRRTPPPRVQQLTLGF